MKLMLVDDERLALAHLEKILLGAADRLSETIEIKTFQFAKEALRELHKWKPDVVFLDIHMPEINGLQAALSIQEQCPETEIVFVTAYDDYAVDAFDLNAIDYVLKPYSAERVAKTVQRIITRRVSIPMQGKADSASRKQKVISFRTIRFQQEGLPPELPKWRTAKAQELFGYLLQRRGEVVLKSAIMELLTPQLDQKRAMTQLYTAIYQIRQCLRQSGMDISINNASIQEGYVLQVGDVVVDVEEWERELSRLGEENMADCAEELERVLEQYEGGYLEDHDYVWAEGERERLRQLWLSQGRRLAAYNLEKNDLAFALKLYERIQQLDPYHESEGLLTMKLYDLLCQYDKVAAHYKRLEEVFVRELGLTVPMEAERWFSLWQQRN